MSCVCDYDAPAFYQVEKHAARKQHCCEECRRAIQPGETYEKARGKWDGRLDTFKTCARCVALREHIKAHVPCFCWSHGNLLDDMRTEVDNLPYEAEGSGLRFEIGRLAVAIKRAPSFSRMSTP